MTENTANLRIQLSKHDQAMSAVRMEEKKKVPTQKYMNESFTAQLWYNNGTRFLTRVSITHLMT